jgi:protein-disulfide isomerase
MGPDTALLTILYFGDFECSACKQFADMLSAYLAKHTEDVGVVFRHFPLQYHRFAYPSARAAECAADQGRFEAMYRILYAKQDSLGLLTFHELARRASVPDRVRFANCFSESSPVERVERDRAAGTAAQIPGTPGVVIDGVLYAARLPNESVLDSLLAVARTRRR